MGNFLNFLLYFNQDLYHYTRNCGYMSMIETISDVNNTFLARREIKCNFAGLGGKLKKLDAIDMISKEFKLDGKVIIPVNMKSHVGKPLMTGTFYVYDDETIAKKQVNPTIFARLEKARKKEEEQAAEASKSNAISEEAQTKTPDTEESEGEKK